jgi:curved DNA-binding protein CbpA
MLECCSGGGLFRLVGVGESRRGKTVAPVKTLSGRILLPTDGSYCFDPYQLLQVRRDATDREITAGYRRFALLYHPVRRQSSLSTSAHELDHEDDHGFLFTAVAAAYETLMDDEARHALHQILADYHDDESRAGADDGTLSSFDRSEARDERGFSKKERMPPTTTIREKLVACRQLQAIRKTFEVYYRCFHPGQRQQQQQRQQQRQQQPQRPPAR